MKVLDEYDKQVVCNEICEGCDHNIDYGGMDYAYGCPQYFSDWECEMDLTPRDEDCPLHEEYVDKCGEDEDEEEIDDEEEDEANDQY